MGITGEKWSRQHYICVRNDGNEFKIGKMVGIIDGIAGRDRVLLIDEVDIDNEPCHIIRFNTHKINFNRITKHIAAGYPDLFKYSI